MLRARPGLGRPIGTGSSRSLAVVGARWRPRPGSGWTDSVAGDGRRPTALRRRPGPEPGGRRPARAAARRRRPGRHRRWGRGFGPQPGRSSAPVAAPAGDQRHRGAAAHEPGPGAGRRRPGRRLHEPGAAPRQWSAGVALRSRGQPLGPGHGRRRRPGRQQRGGRRAVGPGRPGRRTGCGRVALRAGRDRWRLPGARGHGAVGGPAGGGGHHQPDPSVRLRAGGGDPRRATGPVPEGAPVELPDRGVHRGGSGGRPGRSGPAGGGRHRLRAARRRLPLAAGRSALLAGRRAGGPPDAPGRSRPGHVLGRQAGRRSPGRDHRRAGRPGRRLRRSSPGPGVATGRPRARRPAGPGAGLPRPAGRRHPAVADGDPPGGGAAPAGGDRGGRRRGPGARGRPRIGDRWRDAPRGADPLGRCGGGRRPGGGPAGPPPAPDRPGGGRRHPVGPAHGRPGGRRGARRGAVLPGSGWPPRGVRPRSPADAGPGGE